MPRYGPLTKLNQDITPRDIFDLITPECYALFREVIRSGRPFRLTLESGDITIAPTPPAEEEND